jgi:hypothetical protein
VTDVEADREWVLRVFYERYLQRCNAHRFGELGEFVAADVRVNDRPQGLEQYVAGCGRSWRPSARAAALSVRNRVVASMPGRGGCR